MNRSELREKLDSVPPAVELTPLAQENLQDLLKHPGLLSLYALLLGSRQAYYATLAVAPLGNMGEIARAAVLQGTINGIELFYNTVIEQSVPSRDATKEQ